MERRNGICALTVCTVKKCLARWQDALFQKGWNSLFWNNHDLPRIVKRWKVPCGISKDAGSGASRDAGNALYLSGEELGMTNVKFSDISKYRDVETTNMYYERIEAGYAKADVMRSIYAKSRDNARTPMQWSKEPNAGFTKGTPWIAVNPNYTEINVEEERKDPDSVYQFYTAV